MAHDRPRTICLENKEAEKRADLYILCNPVRARLVRHPADILWKDFSSCRYLAFGEKNGFDDMVEVPGWYLSLGDTPEARQHAFRSILDQYLVNLGLKRDPRLSTGHFFGSADWIADRRRLLRVHGGESATSPPGAPETSTSSKNPAVGD